MVTTWRKELTKLFETTGDTFENLTITLTDYELDKEFDPDFGGLNGEPFTAWTDKYVYFQACYDGAEWVDYVSRNPDGEPTGHIGSY